MKLILGLGNPGDQYVRTRHNLGFMVIDQLTQALSASPWRAEAKFKAALAEAVTPAGQRLLLAKPTTFMNNSGEAAHALAQFYKINPTDIWAIYDDLDTSFGRLRLRTGGVGQGGGHQGVRSLIAHLGPNFVRVKVGISLNDRTTEPSEVYVLKPFKPLEQAQLPQLITAATSLIIDQLDAPTPAESTFQLVPATN